MGLLEELAVRCEAAIEPDRDLEAEIAVAVYGGEIVWKQANYTMEMHPARKYASADHVGGFGNAPVDAYTTSLDAAMQLVPKGWVMTLTVYHDCATASLSDDRINPVRLDTVEVDADTPALALTAASLRARHALAQSKGSET